MTMKARDVVVQAITDHACDKKHHISFFLGSECFWWCQACGSLGAPLIRIEGTGPAHLIEWRAPEKKSSPGESNSGATVEEKEKAGE
jgi:hypothetical protein